MNYICVSFVVILLFNIGNGTRFGQNQKQFKTIFNAIGGEGLTSNIPSEYSSFYRPPSKSNEESNPVGVYIALKDVNIRYLQGVKGMMRASIGGIIETVHNDSRLEHETPPGYSQNFVNPNSVSPNPWITIWSPKVSIFSQNGVQLDFNAEGYYSTFQTYMGTSRDAYPPGRKAYPSESTSSEILTLFNTNGVVYHRKPFTVEIKDLEMDDESKTVISSIQFMDKRYFKEDVELAWSTEDGFKLKDNTDAFNSTLGVSYKVSHSFDKCQSRVNYGPFGDHEYSCVELKLKFIPY